MEHHDLVRQENRDWYVRNREKKIASTAAWHANNRERVADLNSAWRLENKERKYATRNRWRTETGAGNADKALRRAAELQASPPWLTKEHKREIRKLYKLGREMGLHVDHVVPLRGKQVCGLHVPWNLQLLAPVENMQKHNKHLDATA